MRRDALRRSEVGVWCMRKPRAEDESNARCAGRVGPASCLHSPRSPRLPPPAGAADLGTPDRGPARRRALSGGFWARASWPRGLVVQT